jgi:hypothetical protein
MFEDAHQATSLHVVCEFFQNWWMRLCCERNELSNADARRNNKCLNYWKDHDTTVHIEEVVGMISEMRNARSYDSFRDWLQ